MNPIAFDILGQKAQLARPDLAWAVAASALALGLGLWAIRRRRLRLEELGATPRLRERIAPGASHGRRLAAAALSGAGLLLVALALLRPQLGERNQKVTRSGIDLVVALDASRSMHARDVRPSRLERARLELSHLVDRLRGDRVGIVVFAGEAFVQCPLTSDYGAAKLFLRAVDPDQMPTQGTAVAAALDTAGTMLKAAEHGAKTQVVLLVTDGEDHEGDVEAAAARLAEQGVRVFALGIGSPDGTPVPEVDGEGNVVGYLQARGEKVLTRLEEAPLRRVAERTGGRYVSARGGDLGMGELLGELERLEKSEFESRHAVRWAEAWHWLGFPGFALLLLGGVVGEGRRR